MCMRVSPFRSHKNAETILNVIQMSCATCLHDYLNMRDEYRNAGKTLAKILNVHLDQARLLPENQCEFRKFTRQPECQDQNVDLYVTCVNLAKALDTVSLDEL